MGISIEHLYDSYFSTIYLLKMKHETRNTRIRLIRFRGMVLKTLAVVIQEIHHLYCSKNWSLSFVEMCFVVGVIN